MNALFSQGIILLFALPLVFAFTKAAIDGYQQTRNNLTLDHFISSVVYGGLYIILVLLYCVSSVNEFVAYMLAYIGVFWLLFDVMHNNVTGKRLKYFNPGSRSLIDHWLYGLKKRPAIRIVIGVVLLFLSAVIYMNALKDMIGFDVINFGWRVAIGFAVVWLFVAAMDRKWLGIYKEYED